MGQKGAQKVSLALSANSVTEPQGKTPGPCMALTKASPPVLQETQVLGR